MKRRAEGDRLAFYNVAADSRFWTEHWKTGPTGYSYVEAEKGQLGSFELPFTKYLPRSGRILESGCGMGQYVVALRARGYECEGLDWAEETVTYVRSAVPSVPIRVGDATAIQEPDGAFAGYISLGVVEHRAAGPGPFLREAHRVLADDGVMMISVPHFHALRKLKASCGLYGNDNVEGLSFYQYAFTLSEFTSILQSSGFEVVETFSYDGFKGVKDEIRLLRRMLLWRGVGWRLATALRKWRWAERNLGHMALFACRKKR